MLFSNHGRFRQQVHFLRRQFLQDGKLPFTDVLAERTVTQALKALNHVSLHSVRIRNEFTVIMNVIRRDLRR